VLATPTRESLGNPLSPVVLYIELANELGVTRPTYVESKDFSVMRFGGCPPGAVVDNEEIPSTLSPHRSSRSSAAGFWELSAWRE